MQVVERPTQRAAGGKYNAAAAVATMVALGAAEALRVELGPEVKWVNYHNVVYKTAQAAGYKLHYSRSGQALTMWLTAR